MASTGKDHARVNLGIWGDDDWLDLSPAAQHLYFALWTSPGLSYCGAGDWHPGRVSNLAAGWDRESVTAAAIELSRQLFVLVDTETDEYLLRSWIKHDGLWRTPNMAVSMANARAELASRTLRGVVVHEVLKIRDANPESTSWARPAVATLLAQSAVNPVELEPLNPTANPASNPWGQPIGSTPAATVNPNPPSNPGPTPAPTPAPTSSSKKSGARKRGTRIPEEFMPEQSVIDAMKVECPNVNFQTEHRKFVDYWASKAGQAAVKLDWDATWRNWIRNARPSSGMSSREESQLGWDALRTTNQTPAIGA